MLHAAPKYLPGIIYKAFRKVKNKWVTTCIKDAMMCYEEENSMHPKH